MNGEDIAYRTPPLPAASQRHFLPGAGEALPLPAVHLHLEGVIQIEGNLIRYVKLLVPTSVDSDIHSLSVSPRRDYILFSTKSPPTVQRIPWPAVHHEEDEDLGIHKANESLYDTWVLSEDTFPWLVDNNGE